MCTRPEPFPRDHINLFVMASSYGSVDCIFFVYPLDRKSQQYPLQNWTKAEYQRRSHPRHPGHCLLALEQNRKLDVGALRV